MALAAAQKECRHVIVIAPITDIAESDVGAQGLLQISGSFDPEHLTLVIINSGL
jgi:hypothetical protein